MDYRTCKRTSQVLNFPLQPQIAHDRAAAAVRKLMVGDLNLNVSEKHLGPYAADLEYICWQVSLTRGRPQC